MANQTTTLIHWLTEPEEQDYPAAASYLSLLYLDGTVSAVVAELRAAAIVQFKAKDLFRASRLSLLGVSNKHVLHDQHKIEQGKSLSPLLLLRDGPAHGRLVIADGYHRLCAVYSFDEDALIPCKIASMPL